VIDIEYRDRVALVTLNHGKVNALDLELLRAVSDTFRAGLSEAGAVVLTGAGRAFSAGVDLRRIVDGGAAYTREFLPALVDAFLAVFDCPKPVVAAINGHAIAGGCVFAAACDLRLMSGGTIGLTELRVGVPFPVSALEIVGNATGAAQVMALTGRTVDVDHALSIGLVHERVEPDRLLDEAVAQAGSLAAITPEVYAFTKRQLHKTARDRIDARAPIEDADVLRRWSSAEAHAEIGAYLASLAKR
jgi:enoyl-CoA hydratase